MNRESATDKNSEGMEGSYKYWAFISYSHRNAYWAKWLHKRIEGYRLPTKLVQHKSHEASVPTKLSPIFRDQDELPTSADLGTVITRNLEASRHLIVICSPEAAQSRWVNEEIMTFKRLGRSERIHLLIVDGEPNASARPDTAHQECFPSAVLQQVDGNGLPGEIRIEPLAADARTGKDSRHDAMLRLVSGMLGVGFDELKRRDLQRRQRRLLAVMGVSLILTLAMIGLTVAAIRGQREANVQRAKAQTAQALSEQAALVAARERDTAKRRLARNYWNTAVAQRDSYHDLIKASHYFARSAMEFSGSPAEAQNARLAAAGLVHNLQLENILTHSGQVVGARLSQDETRLLTWCRDGSVTLWDLAAGRRLLLMQHDRWVDDATFGEEERSILTQGRDRRVRLWDGQTGKMLVEMQHQGEVSGAWLLRGGLQVLSWAQDDKAALLWDTRTGEVLRRFGHEGMLMGSVLNRAQDRVLTWGLDGTVRIWDTASARPLHVLQHGSACYDASFCRDETSVLVRSENAVLLWSPTQNITSSIAEFNNPVNGAAFDSQERQVLSWSDDGAIQIWRARQGLSTSLRHGGPVSGAVLVADERQVLCWSPYGTVQLWDLETQESLAQFSHARQVNGATYLQGSNHVLSWSDDGTAQLWDAATARPLLQFRHDGPVFGAAFSRNQRRLLTWGFDKTLRLWNLDSALGVTDVKHGNLVWRAQFNRDESRLLTASADGTAHLWDVATGASLHRYAHTHAVYGALFNGDESRVLTWSRDGAARLWDAETEQPICVIQHDNGVVQASFIRPSDSFVSFGLDKTIRVWRGQSQESTAIQRDVTQAQFAPDGRHVIAWNEKEGTVRLLASATGTVMATWRVESGQGIQAVFDASGERVLIWDSTRPPRIVDLATGEERVRLQITETFRQARFDHGGQRVAGWDLDKPVRVWDANSGAPIFAIPRKRAVVDVAFSPDDGQMLVICEDNTAQLWDTATGQARAQMKGERWDQLPVFSRRGSRLLTAHRDGVVRLWDTHSGDMLCELGYGHPALGGLFCDQDRILAWYRNGTVRRWDLQTEAFLDTPSIDQDIEVRTGTRLDEFGQLQVLLEDEWQGKRQENTRRSLERPAE